MSGLLFSCSLVASALLILYLTCSYFGKNLFKPIVQTVSWENISFHGNTLKAIEEFVV